MVSLPDPKEAIKYIESWQRFCNTYGDIVYRVLLMPETECRFSGRNANNFLFKRALEQGEKLLNSCYKEEGDFLEELRENPLL